MRPGPFKTTAGCGVNPNQNSNNMKLLLFTISFFAALILSLHHWTGSLTVLALGAYAVYHVLTPAERNELRREFRERLNQPR